MTNAVAVLETLQRERPEWTPWLSVVAEFVEQLSDPAWDASVPSPASASPTPLPFLANASVSIPADMLRRSLARLIQRASQSRSATMATLDRLLLDEPDLRGLFAAAVCQDRDVVLEAAEEAGADVDALLAVTALWCSAFLHACRRQWATLIPQNWTAPYCPICASWPGFVEVRGIERTRHARCGRCGAEWYARLLRCLYCDNSDHEQLLTLVPQGSAPTSAIEACTKCRGYIKTFTRLQGCAPGEVYLEDLASVDLDIAALDAGYTRPHGTGTRFVVTVAPADQSRQRFGWRT